MNKSKVTILALTPALLLTGCNKKVTFEEFQKKVSEIQIPEGLEVTKIELSYTIKGEEKSEDKLVLEGSAKDISAQLTKAILQKPERAVYSVIIATHVAVFAVEEEKKATYKAGSGFEISYKDENQSQKMEFDKYGACTLMESEANDVYSVVEADYTYSK